MVSETQATGTGGEPETLETLQDDGSDADIFFVTDHANRMILTSNAFARCCNLTPQLIAGRTCFEIIHRTSSPPDYCPFAGGHQLTSPQSVTFHSEPLGGEFEFLISPMINGDGATVSYLHSAKKAVKNRFKMDSPPEYERDSQTLRDPHSSPLPGATHHVLNTFPRRAKGVLISDVQDGLLIQLNRLAVIGELLRGITHQWKQPLNTISLLVQSLQLDFSSNQLADEEMNANVDDIMTRLRLVSEAISDFSGYVRWDDTPETAFIHEVITRAVNMTATYLKSKGITLECTVDPRVTAEGNANELMQAVINILLCCRERFATQKPERPLISVTCLEHSGPAIVIIRDNGHESPIHSGQIPLVPNVTAMEQFARPDIGFAVAKLIIEKRLGGGLTVTTTGSGAEFKIELGNSA